MDNFSILDQIISNQKAEEIDNLDAVEIINNLFSELTEREQDVLIRRYGLHSGKKETLESIGNAHQLTRERIRQIETSSVKKLQQLENLKDFIDNLKSIIYQLLEEHGGLMEKEYLLELLVGFSLGGFRGKDTDKMVHKNYLNFLITKLLHDEFEEIINSKHFKESYKLRYKDLIHFEEVIEELLAKIQEEKKIQITAELISMIKTLEAYKKHEERLKSNGTLDIAKVLKFDLYEENQENINQNKALYSILRSAKKIEQNKFGHWGAYHWREIKPKTINDKIFLVLKNHNQPMHFGEIADKINEVEFDKKKANAATVHNELILDNKYVLVGRGLYGLKEWGYKKGTVADVIIEILSESEQPLSRDDIIERVFEKRMVKKATIILALMNKDRFQRVEGKYAIKDNN